MHRQMSVVDCSCEIVSLNQYQACECSTYVVASLRLPKANVLAGKTNNVTLVVHNTSTSTTGTNIDTNVVVQLWSQLIVRVNRHLSRLLPRLLAVWLTNWHSHDSGVFVVKLCDERLYEFR